MGRHRSRRDRPRSPNRSFEGGACAIWLLVIASMVLLQWAVQLSRAASDLDQRLRDERQELKDLKGQLKDYQHRFDRTKRREQTVLQELEATNRLLQQKGRDLQTHERHLKAQAEKYAVLIQEMKALAQRLQVREGILHRRLRALYMQGRFAYLPLLLSASDVSDFFERVRFIMRLAEYDAELLRQHRTSLDELERTRRAVKEREGLLATSRLRVAAKKEEIEKERLKKDKLLTTIREEKGTYVGAMRELQQASARLVSLIAELEQQRKRELARQAREQRQARLQPSPQGPGPLDARDSGAQGWFAKLRGKLSWPVEGTLASAYGKTKHPTFNTYTFNKGIGIATALGSEFRAIEAGRVLYADWFKGYGNLLIVDHGDSYYSLYAHAAELFVQVGENVKRHQVVGKTGEGGALDGPSLYFEIRHHGKTENPLEWLANHRP